MNEHNRQYRKETYPWYLNLVCWLLVIGVSVTIWYQIGKAFYTVYQSAHPKPTPAFRAHVGLLEHDRGL
jgi:hypothetical protein